MKEHVFEFSKVVAASHTEDGSMLMLETIGLGDTVRIFFPTKLVPIIMTTIFTALERIPAELRTQGSLVTAVQGLSVQEEPGSDNVHLLVSVQTGAPPVAYSLPKSKLVEIAVGFLQTQGLVVEEQTGSTQ